MTAPIVFAGAIAKQIIKCENIEIYSHIKNIGKVCDLSIDMTSPDTDGLKKLKTEILPFIDNSAEKKAKEEIIYAKEKGDSLGGSIEAVICGVKPGIGSPFFDSVESRISSLLFSIPAVKSVEFGIGKDFSQMYGSEANDIFQTDGKNVYTKTNNNGGINGGITNGMPIVLTVVIKPTPSISKEQETVNIKTKENIKTKISGRHDPCIVQRAVPVIEGALAIALLDMILEAKTYA